MWEKLLNEANRVYFVKQNIKSLIPDCYPFNHIAFQVFAHQNPLFTVAMEIGQKSKILR